MSKIIWICALATITSCYSYKPFISAADIQRDKLDISRLVKGKTYLIQVRSSLKHTVTISDIDSQAIHGTFALKDADGNTLRDTNGNPLTAIGEVQISDVVGVESKKIGWLKTSLLGITALAAGLVIYVAFAW